VPIDHYRLRAGPRPSLAYAGMMPLAWASASALLAKCAVAYDAVLFVSSANLTVCALTLNMELGLLIQGGSAPRAVADHFTRLIAKGVLEGVQ